MTNADRRRARAADARKTVPARDALVVAGALQRAIFNSANFSSIATDASGVIQVFNVGAERMLGYTAAEVVNQITPADISDPNELIVRASALSEELGTPIMPGFEALVFKASRGIEDIYELTYIRKDKSRFAAVVSVTALRDDANVIIGYLLIGTDNTARKQVEEERARLDRRLRDQHSELQEIQLTLQQKNAELEDASRMKSEFLANMSHELRTPLNAIIGFSEILRDGLMGELTDQQRGFIGDIFSSGQHLLSLINDILDLSKVEAGKMLLDLEPVQVASLLRNSLSIVREKAADRRIRLSMTIDEEIGAMHADGRKFKQIVYNLLSNAVKFSVEGGQVTLAATRVSAAQVGVLTTGSAGRAFPLESDDFETFLQIAVTDTGIGMPTDSLQQLFMPFSQIDSGLARKFEGTGLGLAMVKLLAELHGGSVAVESSVGNGSTFTVWLPFRSPEDVEAVATTSSAQSLELLPGDQVALVVEDDFKSAELIRVQLEAEGFKVLHAPSAEAGLELAASRQLSMITLDIMLPNMDGWEFLKRIKQVEALKRVPVVVISIVADADTGFALGAAAVMQKPISRKELYDSLMNLGLLPPPTGESLDVVVVDDSTDIPTAMARREARI